MYPTKKVYLVAAVLDLFLRFSWCLTIIPEVSEVLGLTGKDHRGWKNIVLWSLGGLEIFRRTYWTLLRVEFEHLYNSQGYRRVDFIPLHFDSEVLKSKKLKQSKANTRQAVILELIKYSIINH
eukprot:snap_masked-scaffold_28-processed-gene-0.11-mRNA-1 protein AED:0.28 eAED:0.30 QI:0/0/0/0.5/1/1/2/0/122